MKIALYTGQHLNPWNPDTNLGNTEQCILYLAKYLAFFEKNEVWVVGDVIEGNYDLVKYRTIETFKQESKYVDTIISVNYINYLKEFENFNYKNSLLWVHDLNYSSEWKKEISNHKEFLLNPKLTAIICLTYWQKDRWLEQYPETYGKILVIRNGIEVNNLVQMWPQPKFEKGRLFPPLLSQQIKKIPNQFIYSSHPKKGLAQLLEDWPHIKHDIPDATLKICIPFSGLQYFEDNFNSLNLNLEGVEFLGTLSRQELYQLMAKSQYWYYPSSYEETFCNTALEMLSHKVLPVTWEWGGLKETLQGFNAKNFDEEIDWRLVKTYISNQNWRYKVSTDWIPLLIKMNMNLNFIYVATINSNKELHKKTEQVHMPSDFSFWLKPGFNGLTTNQTELSKFGVKKHPKWQIPTHWSEYSRRKVTDGEVGCALSHIDIWVDSYCQDRDYTFVLEEDFQETHSVHWDEVQNLFEKGYDLIYLGRESNEPDKELVIKNFPNWVEAGYNHQAHAYILSKRATQILVEQYIERYKSKIFAIDEFLPIVLGKTFRQDILAEFSDLPKLKGAAPVVNFFEQETNNSLTELNKSYSEIFEDSNWDEWCAKYINPFILNNQYELLVNEINNDTIEFPVFTKKFCSDIINLAEDNDWFDLSNQPLLSLGLNETYDKVLQQFIYPVLNWFWELEDNTWTNLKSKNTVTKNTLESSKNLKLHHSNSEIVLNVKLNDNFIGGEIYIPKHKISTNPKKEGNVICFPGGITYKYSNRPIEEGTQYTLTSLIQKP